MCGVHYAKLLKIILQNSRLFLQNSASSLRRRRRNRRLAPPRLSASANPARRMLAARSPHTRRHVRRTPAASPPHARRTPAARSQHARRRTFAARPPHAPHARTLAPQHARRTFAARPPPHARRTPATARSPHARRTPAARPLTRRDLPRLPSPAAGHTHSHASPPTRAPPARTRMQVSPAAPVSGGVAWRGGGGAGVKCRSRHALSRRAGSSRARRECPLREGGSGWGGERTDHLFIR